jgi:hypothetical protein
MTKLPAYILTNPNSGRHLYGRGWLGLIPLIGAFVGVGLVALGVFKYKDKKLVLIGVGGILFSVILYGGLFLFMFSDTARKQLVTFVPQRLNTLVKELEFYKLQKGEYPDSLDQLLFTNRVSHITDPVSINGPGPQKKYNYRKVGDRYLLFSSGFDKTIGTADDIYPTIDSTGCGFILPQVRVDGH